MNYYASKTTCLNISDIEHKYFETFVFPAKELFLLFVKIRNHKFPATTRGMCKTTLPAYSVSKRNQLNSHDVPGIFEIICNDVNQLLATNATQDFESLMYRVVPAKIEFVHKIISNTC